MSSIKNIYLWILILVLTAIPIILWITMQPLNSRFANFDIIMTSFGQLSGLVGMALLSLVFFVNIFKKFKIHHTAGTICFILLIFHPVFLAVKYLAFSLRQAALFILPGMNWSINYGIMALLIMEILLVITYFIKLDHTRWKISHMLLAIVYLFAILHIYFVSSDISRNLLLRYYMFALAILGLVSLCYRIFYQIHQAFKPKNTLENTQIENVKEEQIQNETQL